MKKIAIFKDIEKIKDKKDLNKYLAKLKAIAMPLIMGIPVTIFLKLKDAFFLWLFLKIFGIL